MGNDRVLYSSVLSKRTLLRKRVMLDSFDARHILDHCLDLCGDGDDGRVKQHIAVEQNYSVCCVCVRVCSPAVV